MNNNIVEFTIKNLNLRIDKLCDVITYNEAKLKNAKRDNNTSLIKEVGEVLDRCNKTIDGYENALKKLNNNGVLTDTDIEYIVKSLTVRKNKLVKRVEDCNSVIVMHERALKTKEDMVVGNTAIGNITMKHYDDVAISVIEKSKARLKTINTTLDNCNRALAIFKALK